MKIPIVTIIGKPNVGKSTFFNRIVGTRIAITTEEAGTTRDRIFYKIGHPEMDFFLVDTGGLNFEKTEENIEDNIQEQAHIAIEESDLIIFMVSNKEDFSKSDFKAAELLRKISSKKPVILVANKCDHPLTEGDLAHMYTLGLGKPSAVSAIHNTGIGQLKKDIIANLKEKHFLTKSSKQYKAAEKFDESHLNIAIVGKPNVGKSSIINALLNQEKLIVSDVPGTTRDSTDSTIHHQDKDYNFIDTAGMRRQSKVNRGIEHFSVLRTLSSINRCDVAILVLDSADEISHQDKQIANTILKANKGLIILANKWDLKEDQDETEDKRKSRYVYLLQKNFPFLPWAPVLFTSAKTKKNLTKVFDLLDSIKEEQARRISTAKLNRVIEEIVEKHKPTGTSITNPKLLYATQVDINPPHFVLFVNKKRYFHFSYFRYFENRLRETFGFEGTPIKIECREKEAR